MNEYLVKANLVRTVFTHFRGCADLECCFLASDLAANSFCIYIYIYILYWLYVYVYMYTGIYTASGQPCFETVHLCMYMYICVCVCVCVSVIYNNVSIYPSIHPSTVSTRPCVKTRRLTSSRSKRVLVLHPHVHQTQDTHHAPSRALSLRRAILVSASRPRCTTNETAQPCPTLLVNRYLRTTQETTPPSPHSN